MGQSKPGIMIPFRLSVQGMQSAKQIFSTSRFVVFAFTANWCPYSSKLIEAASYSITKQFKYLTLAQISIDYPPNFGLLQMFKVSQVPAIFLCDGSLANVLYKFVGDDQDEMKKMLKVYEKALNQTNYSDIKKPVSKVGSTPEPINLNNLNPIRIEKRPIIHEWISNFCRRGHPLSSTHILPAPYVNNTYKCDICQTINTPNIFMQAKHCQICQFDVCPNCSTLKTMKRPNYVISD